MQSETFISVRRLVQRLGLSAAWLKAEADAKRIPSLKTGRRRMFNAGEVERALLERAAAPAGGEAGNG